MELNEKGHWKLYLIGQVSVYFPGNELWYDIWTSEKWEVKGEVNFAAPYDRIPVFQRGGTIIPK